LDGDAVLVHLLEQTKTFCTIDNMNNNLINQYLLLNSQ
jgi:hypothetical protein